MDKKQYLISVIVPIYNVEAYLERCIDSIITQEYQKLQIILVDDGSTDGSGGICDWYSTIDKRIKVVHKSNGGLVSARKAGLDCAEGDYIGFVDGDDYIDSMMYQRLLEGLVVSDADFIHFGYMKDQDRDSLFGVEKERTCQIIGQNRLELIRKCILNPANPESISSSIWSKLFRRDIILKAYGNVPNKQCYGEDILCLCHCFLESTKIILSCQGYYHYITRESSICHERKITNLTREIELYKCLCELFQKRGLLPAIQKDIESYFLRNVSSTLGELIGRHIPIYQYPCMEELKHRRIALFGAGEVGQAYYAQICLQDQCQITAWVDNHSERYCFDYYKVAEVDTLKDADFDYVIIAVLMEKTAQNMILGLAKIGIAREKILWRKPQTII